MSKLSCNLWSLDFWSLLWSSNYWCPGYDTAGHAIASLCSVSFWCCKMQSAELSMFNLLWVLWWWHCIHMHSCCPVSQTAFLDNEFEFCIVCEFWFPFIWLCLGGGGIWVFVQFVDSFSRYTYGSQCLGDKIVMYLTLSLPVCRSWESKCLRHPCEITLSCNFIHDCGLDLSSTVRNRRLYASSGSAVVFWTFYHGF